MAQHLVKKAATFVDKGLIIPKLGESTYCETRVNGNPSGYKLKINDTIFIAEAGYAIISCGKVTETPVLTKIRSLEELFEYISTSKIKQGKYWFNIAMEKIFKRSDFSYLSILEYTISNKPLEIPVPLDSRFNKQSSWYYLPETFKIPTKIQSLDLSAKIPASLRFKLFYSLNSNVDGSFVDVDHFVPKSIGGPGNIEENLHLVGLSINRKKSDQVPAGLYIIAENMGISTVGLSAHSKRSKDIFQNGGVPFFADNISKRIASDVVAIINRMEIKQVREFYRSVKSQHGLV
jgi:hypothetical protein